MAQSQVEVVQFLGPLQAPIDLNLKTLRDPMNKFQWLMVDMVETPHTAPLTPGRAEHRPFSIKAGDSTFGASQGPKGEVFNQACGQSCHVCPCGIQGRNIDW